MLLKPSHFLYRVEKIYNRNSLVIQFPIKNRKPIIFGGNEYIIGLTVPFDAY